MSVPDSPEPDPGGTADERAWRAAKRTVVLFVVAVAAAAIGAVALLSGVVGEDGGDTTVDPADGDAAAVTAIGPETGTDVAGYVDDRRAHLTEVEGRRLAVVSFTSYVTEEQADGLLVDGLDRRTMLLAFPSGPSMLGESVADARAVVVHDAEAQLADISELVNTVEDPEFAEFYRAELLRYRALIDDADRQDVVHGAVVVGRAADLRALASGEEVRLVDVGDGSELADDATVAGLRPEETVTTGEPEFRP